MRVFRRTYNDKGTGERREVARAWVEFRDHNRIVRRWPAFESEKLSARFGDRLERLVECRRNHDAPDESLLTWLDGLPADLRARMVEIGLIDTRRTAGDRPLSAHLDGERDGDGKLTLPGFRQKLESKGNTPGHVAQQVRRVRQIFDGCGFVFWSDLSAPGATSTVESYLEKLRTADAEIGGRTARYYAQAIKQFCRWMVRDKRARTNPMSDLETVAHDTDSEERRALSEDEMRWLLKGAKANGEAFGVSAADRDLLYRFAYETGFRAGQIRKLTVASFTLDADPPTVTAKAATVKRRVKNVQVLRPALAVELAERFASKVPTAPAFRMPVRTADMLAHDLSAARAAWIAEAAKDPKEQERRQRSDFLADVDHQGRRVVFHSLRHTHGTLLGNAGVPQKDIQASLHHTRESTTVRYLHSDVIARQAALSRLPEVQTATGTDGRGVEAPLSGIVRPTVRTGRAETGSGGSEGAAGEGVKPAKQPENRDSDCPRWESNPHDRYRSSDFKSTDQRAGSPTNAGKRTGRGRQSCEELALRGDPRRAETDEPEGGIEGVLARLAGRTRRLCGEE